MEQGRVGVLAMLGACTIWGLSPLYYKLLSAVPPPEILAHRTLWSLTFFAGVLLVQGRLSTLREAVSGPDRGRILLAAVLISTNWFLFILSIQIGRATEASLGYYIFPLVAVVLGVVAFGERPDRLQIVAIVLAALAVLVLTIRLGHPPVISLMLAFTFGFYGLVKKGLNLGAVVSVTAEVLFLAPIALIWLARVHLATPEGGVFLNDTRLTALLVLSGPLTALPLILFSMASRRISLGTVGLLQYLNPTLQFFCAVLVFGEPFGTARAVSFMLIWTALAIYTAASLRREAARSRAERAALTDPTTP